MVCGGTPCIGKLIEALAVDDLGWQDYANCRGADADLFFPERGASTRKAKGICAACQVQVDCLEFAVTKEREVPESGVALSERERRKIRKARALETRRIAAS